MARLAASGLTNQKVGPEELAVEGDVTKQTFVRGRGRIDGLR